MVAGGVLGLMVSGLAAAQTAPAAAPAAKGPETKAPETKSPEAKAGGGFRQAVPVAAAGLDMVAVPASPDGSVKAFYLSKTEVTWEVFDVFAFRLDLPAETAGGDATTRPSKPYLPPDRGFGHEGFAAICMSFRSATEFCAWLSHASGRHYRLATEAEWEWACHAGGAVPEGAALEEAAWFGANSGGTPHAVGTKKANAWGLSDMLGNVQEWVVGRDGKPVTKGGSYRDDAGKLTAAARAAQDASWNGSDPQIPKSRWWLSDGPFVGFRVACDVAEKTDGEKDKGTTTKPGSAAPAGTTEPKR